HTTKMEDPLVPATNGAAIGRSVSPAPPPTSTIDPQLIISYLESVLHVTLGASKEELQANNSFLSPENLPETLARCQRFASEAQVAIYVQQEALDTADGIQGDGDALVSTQSTYLLDSKLTYTPSTASCVAILKRPVPILPTVPISSQLSVINLPGAGASLATNPNAGSSTSPFEALHSLVHFALAPYFDACTKSQESNHAYTKHTDAESRTGIPGAKRRIAELELSLRNLQQNIDVPDLHLPIHPVIQA
ncbi:dynein heavy chain, partial [Aureobasidium melanogenum]